MFHFDILEILRIIIAKKQWHHKEEDLQTKLKATRQKVFKASPQLKPNRPLFQNHHPFLYPVLS